MNYIMNQVNDNKHYPFFSVIDAATEIKKRHENKELRSAVENYLQGDIPEYFKVGPVYYLPRHVATPNHETIRFVNALGGDGSKIVIGQDSGDKLVSKNPLKRALGKLQFFRNTNDLNAEVPSGVRKVIDFGKYDGKKIHEIKTLWGESLMDFHNRLFYEIVPAYVVLVDDANWINRNGRGDIKEHYIKLLALSLAHGVFFEDLLCANPDDAYFVEEVILPACKELKQRFGFDPLIVDLGQSFTGHNQFWYSYPDVVNELIDKSLASI